MAAFSSFQFNKPGALSQRASVASPPPILRRRATALAEMASRVRVVCGEILLLLWTILALAFSLLVVAGFFL
jgi:hypothetical protein